MSSSPDPQTWVFPPLGAPSPPGGVAAAFGPVAKGDKIKLQWTPASEQPDVNLICSNDGTTIPIGNNNASPLQYTFSETLGGGDDDQTYICHFFFANTQVGNTVTFQYLNTPSSSPTTWQQNTQLQSALAGGASGTTSISTSSGTSTSTVSSSASFITVTEPSTTFVAIATGAAAPAQGDSNQPSASPTSAPSSGLSVGAGAGIGVGAAVIFCGLIFLAIWIVRRTRKNKQPGPLPVPQGDSAYYSQASKGPPPMGQQTNTLPTAFNPHSRSTAPQHYGPQGLHELGPSG